MRLHNTLFTISVLFFNSAFALTATYQVPVPSEDLAPYAQFPLKSLKIKGSNPTQLSYRLPAVLDGTSDRVEFEGNLPSQQEPSTVLTGPQGSMKCELQNENTRCKVTYYDLAIDSQNVTEAIEKVAKSPEELFKRQRVGELFACDPVGVITLGPHPSLRPLKPILRPIGPRLNSCSL